MRMRERVLAPFLYRSPIYGIQLGNRQFVFSQLKNPPRGRVEEALSYFLIPSEAMSSA